MSHKLQLLAVPDTRPLWDANEWLGDGFRLIRRFPGLWAAYSGIGYGLFFLVFATLMASAEFDILFIPMSLVSLLWVYWLIVLQSGAFRLMSTISDGEKPRLGEMFWLLGQTKRGSFWQYFLFFVVLKMTLAMLFRLSFAQPFWFDGFQLVNQHLLIGAIGVNLVAVLVALAISWAILPILSHFPATDFTTAFRLQISGTLRNWRPLVFFGLIIFAVSFFASFLVGVSFQLFPPLGLAVFVAFLLWLWPMMFAWGFSAARHIFMRW